MEVNQTRDAEIVRQKRNLTESQKKNATATKEGVVVNSLIKEPCSVNINDTFDSMIISQNTKMPEKINENKTSKEKSILPISLIATGVMSTMAFISLLAKRSAKHNVNLALEYKQQPLQRNLAINDEMHQAIVQMVLSTNPKTILATVGVLTISAMGFMGKMFIDGFKDVWVKKREADIQKNLQENLIEVETQSFSGKIQIIRSMLSEKAKEFQEYLTTENNATTAFQKSEETKNVNFKSNKEEEENNDNLKYFGLGILTLGSIIGFGYMALKNLRGSKEFIDKGREITKETVTKVVSESNELNKEQVKEKLSDLLQNLNADKNYIKEELSKLNWQTKEEINKFIEDVSFEIKKSSTQADKALGGGKNPKPSFYSHVNDYRAFFYNWLLDTKNPVFKSLFFGVTGVTALSYGGKVLGEAMKEVEVKKMNAQTELDLQKRLVSTELRNFKAKKDAAINPLTEEFYTQVQNGKPKEELKTIAENILFEVKNGPPFVYS